MNREELYSLIYTYPTNDKAGFNPDEINEILSKFPDINMDRYYDALMGDTCMMDKDGKTIRFHCDVYKGILCGMENRKLKVSEWD